MLVYKDRNHTNHLDRSKSRFRDSPLNRAFQYPGEQDFTQATDKRICAATVCKCQAIATNQPDQRRNATYDKTLHQDGQHIPASG